MSELISIIIPFFNIEEYFNECLESVINQTYKNIEIILVNDGSTDNSLEIAKKYKEKDARIKIFTTKNQGAAKARNFGLTKANGEFISFIDSDDIVDNDYIEFLVKLNNKYNKKIVCLEPDSFKNKVIEKLENEKTVVYEVKDALKDLFLTKISSGITAKLFHKSLFFNNKFNDYLIAEDFELLFRIFKEVPSIAYSYNKKYHYRIRDGSIMHSSYCDKNNTVFELLDSVEENCDESLRKEFAYYKTSILQDHYKILAYSKYKDKNKIQKIIRTRYKKSFIDKPQDYMNTRQKLLGFLMFMPLPIYKIFVNFIRIVKKVISWKFKKDIEDR